jgi:hypothetical protein
MPTRRAPREPAEAHKPPTRRFDRLPEDHPPGVFTFRARSLDQVHERATTSWLVAARPETDSPVAQYQTRHAPFAKPARFVGPEGVRAMRSRPPARWRHPPSKCGKRLCSSQTHRARARGGRRGKAAGPLGVQSGEIRTVRNAPTGGAPGRIRTCDLPLRRRLLCPLSYGDIDVPQSTHASPAWTVWRRAGRSLTFTSIVPFRPCQGRGARRTCGHLPA